MFIDIYCTQEKKYNQNTFGDYFVSKRDPETDRLLAVLSDGLGSGIKANILASMTATMLLKFIEADSDVRKACEIMMNSLPVCQIRKISYSTFSVMNCNSEGITKIVEEGNPQFLWIRDNEVLEPECEIITSETFKNRKMHVYKIQLKEGDRLIFCSDGVTQSGLGTDKFKLGLRRKGLIEAVLHKLKEDRYITSRDLSKYIVDFACSLEPDRCAKDDVSAVCVHCRKPRKSMVFTGPPYHMEKDNYYANVFKNFEGKKAISGGTTANLISRELNIPIDTPVCKNIGKLPSISYMEGVDLVTEGILTLTKTYEYLEDENEIRDDAAGDLVKFLLNSDCIIFMVGAKLNQAHYDPNLPIEIEIRKNIIKKIAKVLEEKYVKKVTIQFM